MKYIDDIRIKLQNQFPNLTIYLENFGNAETIVDQVVIVSEPSMIEDQVPISKFNFSIYVQNEDQQKANDISTDILLFLNNIRFVGSSGVNLFSLIQGVSPPYYFSNGSKFPIYLIKFNSTIIDRQIKTFQHISNNIT